MKISSIALCLCLSVLVLWRLPVHTAHARGPMRILAVESGPYIEYYYMLYGIAVRLQEEGYFRTIPPYEPNKTGTAALWKWMREHSDSRLVFLSNGFFSGEWNNEKLKEIQQNIVNRLTKRKDIDIILAFGTSAGQTMAKIKTDVPVVVASTTNAIEAGIIPSEDDSGKNNLIALVDPLRYKRQIEYFHTILPFRTLGIVYEDTQKGKSIVSLKEIEAAAETLSVEIVPCVADQLYDLEPFIIADRLEACHRTLAEKKVDAVYLTSLSTVNPEQIPRVLSPLLDAHIPHFSQTGDDEVKHGVLLGFVGCSFAEGRYAADVLLRISEGVLPRALSQRFHNPLQLGINLGTAASIGWNPSLSTLLDVSEFY